MDRQFNNCCKPKLIISSIYLQAVFYANEDKKYTAVFSAKF